MEGDEEMIWRILLGVIAAPFVIGWLYIVSLATWFTVLVSLYTLLELFGRGQWFINLCESTAGR